MGLYDNLKDKALQKAQELASQAQQSIQDAQTTRKGNNAAQQSYVNNSTQSESSSNIQMQTPTKDEDLYDHNLEKLIDAALADGVLTEKEKQVLFKKAQQMGIDLDEFEMVLDARLVKLKKQEAKENKQYELEMAKAKQAPKSAPSSNKYGDVRKCPSCGAIVEAYTAVCPQCGYAFSNVEAVSSWGRLAKELDKIEAESSTLSSFGLKKYNRIAATIKNFPVPLAKADLLEFIINLEAQLSSGSDDLYVTDTAYRSKIKECIMKAELLFPNDPQFKPFIEKNNNQTWWQRLPKKKKYAIVAVIVGGALWVLMILVAFIGYIIK